MDVRLPYTHHLVTLVAEACAVAGRLADLPEDQRDAAASAARRASSHLSARLDGSPLDDETVAAVDSGRWERPGLPVPDGPAPSGGWATALRLDGMATQDVAAIEYANLLQAHAAEERLADGFFDEPLDTLARLHGLMCAGLVDPEVIGRPRRTAQAVHDGAQGRVIYNAAEPDDIPGLLEALQRWLRGDGAEGSAAFAAPIVAAVVHELILQWQPYEAANGRIARAAARVVLRARGMDAFALAVPEGVWTSDPGGYYGEVAATIRRRGDLTPWTERHTESLLQALREAVARVRPQFVPVPAPRAWQAAESLAQGQRITVAEYAEQWGVSRETALKDLRALAEAGAVVEEPRTLGRRFHRV